MSLPRNILILSGGPACNNPRAHKEACTLAAAGYRTTLLGPGGTPEQDAFDARLSQEAGYRRLALPAFPRLIPRAATWLCRRLVPFGVESVRALGDPGRLLKAALAEPSDLCIVHTELPLWVGLRLLDRGRLVAADFEDWHSEDLLPEARRHRPLRLLRSVEKDLLHRALYCSSASELISNQMQVRYGGRKPDTLHNCFPLQPRPAIEARSAPPSFFWFSQTVGPGRGLEPFLQAWAGVKAASNVVILGKSHGDYPRHLLSLVPPEQRGQITFLPPVSPFELPGLIARHDIGLALEESTLLNRDYASTNKLFQYLNAGLAVVASDTSGQRKILAEEPEAGILVDLKQPELIRHSLEALLADTGRLRVRQQAARRLAEQRHNWERESKLLLHLVGQALDSAGRPATEKGGGRP